MEIIKTDYFPFEEYKENVDKYAKSDNREINFQNRVILQLLERVFINDKSISVVDVSTQYKNKESKWHTREFYAGDKTPDFLIVKDWNYNNISKEEKDYLAVVEIKSPVLDPIYNNKKHTLAEVENYIAHGRKVILTDCYEWRFYSGKNTDEFIQFILHDGNGWCLQEIENPEYIVKEFGFDNKRLESIKWNSLLKYIKDFVLE